MIRMIIASAVLYFVFYYFRRFLAQRSGRRPHGGAGADDPRFNEKYPNAIDAEFEELDQK